MSSPLQSQAIAAPGFKGLNSQDASADLPEGYALTASNCVIDKFGRIGSRKGLLPIGPQTLGKVTFLGEVRGVQIEASNTAFTVNGVFAYAAVDGHETQGATMALNVGGAEYLVMSSSSAVPLIFDGAVVTPLAITGHPPGLSAADFRPSIITTGFGRLWAAGPGGGTVVYFSDTLNPRNWSSGVAGRLDLTSVVGEDTITGIVMHNNSLVIFLRNNILIYSGAAAPASMALSDTINGLGCIAKYSIQRTGEDVIFLSRTGVRSLNRTIQEKSAPLNDLSKNVRDELMLAVSESIESGVRSTYSPENSFYLLAIPEAGVTYCFDTRIPGQWRATTWTVTPSALRTTKLGAVLFGGANGVLLYAGASDSGKSFRMVYSTSWITAGAPTVIKILKKLSSVLVGGGGISVVVKTAWDYRAYSQAHLITMGKYPLFLYGKALFGKALYARGPVIENSTINVGGSGRALQLTLEAEIIEESLSIQSLGLYMKVGKSL